MRRKDKEIPDSTALWSIIAKADYCHIALCTHGMPYIVPMNFGFSREGKGVFYFHSANAGLKLNLIKDNPHVFLNFIADAALLRNENPCEWGMRYSSVSCSGTAEIITEPDKKAEALNAIMAHYDHNTLHTFNESALQRTTLFKVTVIDMTGKAGG